MFLITAAVLYSLVKCSHHCALWAILGAVDWPRPQEAINLEIYTVFTSFLYSVLTASCFPSSCPSAFAFSAFFFSSNFASKAEATLKIPVGEYVHNSGPIRYNLEAPTYHSCFLRIQHKWEPFEIASMRMLHKSNAHTCSGGRQCQ